MVTFAPYPGDVGSSSIRARRYDSVGTALGLSFQVNSYTPLTQRAPRIRTAPDSTFVVVWESSGSAGTDTADKSVQMRRLASDGTPLSEDFQVNTYSTGDASFIQAAFGDDGGLVIAWGNDGGSPVGDNDGAVAARRFDSSGEPVGADFQVNETYVGGYQVPNGLAATPEGGFLVTWAGDAVGSDDTSNWAVAGLRLDSEAGPMGSEFVINTLTTGYQTYARLAVDAEGDYMVVWDSAVSAGDDGTESIQGRYFAVQIFADGFDSGDTTAWSATVD